MANYVEYLPMCLFVILHPAGGVGGAGVFTDEFWKFI